MFNELAAKMINHMRAIHSVSHLSLSAIGLGFSRAMLKRVQLRVKIYRGLKSNEIRIQGDSEQMRLLHECLYKKRAASRENYYFDSAEIG